MDRMIIHGGHPLEGTVAISGAKNAALPILACCLLHRGPCILDGIPRLADVQVMGEMLRRLGMRIDPTGPQQWALTAPEGDHWIADPDLVRRMRASFCVLGPLIARYGRARVALPGGCRLGPRPVDIHLRGLEALGATIRICDGMVEASAKRLIGKDIDLSGPHGSSVTGTCNVLSAAILAQGQTILRGAAREPEVVDLGNFLQKSGARIQGLGSSVLVVDGVSGLTGCQHQIISDRIEAGTFLLAAVITRGTITLKNCSPPLFRSVITQLEQLGVPVTLTPNSVTLQTPAALRPGSLTMAPYPQMPTDLQAPWTAVLGTIPGRSQIADTVFPDRFAHLPELQKFGFRLNRVGNSVQIEGQPTLSPAHVQATDLRASAGLLLAALAIPGQSTILDAGHIERGYESFPHKFQQLGAQITVERSLEHRAA